VHNGTIGHHGCRRTHRLLVEKKLIWRGMHKDIKNFIQSCPVCQKLTDKPTNSHGAEYILSSPVPNKSIAIDTCGPFTEDPYGYCYIVVIVDCFSKWTELYPAKSTTAEECARILLRYYANNGVPDEIWSDQGTQFHNQLLASFTKLVPTQQKFTIPHNSRQNGIAENAIKKVRQLLKSTLFDNLNDLAWSDAVYLVQRSINTVVNESTSYSPAAIRFGHFNNTKVPLSLDNADKAQLDSWLQSVAEFHTRVQQHIANAVQTRANTKDSTTSTTFNVGSYVLLENTSHPKGDLLAPRRTGPYRVISQDRDQVTLQDLNTPSRNLSVHVSRCRPYISRPNEDLQQEALRGSPLYIVDEILSHKVLPRRNRRKLSPIDIHLSVKWRGYSEPTNEPLSNMSIRNSAAFVRYAQNIPQLQQFIKTTLPTNTSSS
jgi:transposase InsO family protein